MSDILIKGMEMPTSCIECPCCRHDNWNGETAHQCNVSFITFGAEDENWIYNTRPNWCPLTELPPHGRLGDLDELWDRMYNYIDNEGAKMPFGDNDFMIHRDSACELIEDTPTVIEAEGET